MDFQPMTVCRRAASDPGQFFTIPRHPARSGNAEGIAREYDKHGGKRRQRLDITFLGFVVVYRRPDKRRSKQPAQEPSTTTVVDP